LWSRTPVFGDIRVQVQWAQDVSRAALGFDNSLAVREFDHAALHQAVASELPGCELRFEIDLPQGATQ